MAMERSTHFSDEVTEERSIFRAEEERVKRRQHNRANTQLMIYCSIYWLHAILVLLRIIY